MSPAMKDGPNLFIYYYLIVSLSLAGALTLVNTPLGKVRGREELFAYSGQLLDVFNGVPYAKVSFSRMWSG